MVPRLVLAALAGCALAGTALAQEAQRAPLSTDISAQLRGGGFSGGRGFSGGGLRSVSGGGGRSLAGGGLRSFSGPRPRQISGGGGLRSTSGGGFRFAGTHFRHAAPGHRIGRRVVAGALAAPGLRQAYRSAWHGDRHHGSRHIHRRATLVGLGGLWWGSAYYHPSSFVSGPTCSGHDADGCLLRWADVPVGNGYYTPRCVAYCSY